MSKLGDLIVRLRLQYDDYKKGLKRVDADTKGFAGTLGKIKGVGLAVWGAIGAGVTAMAKSFVNHSQTMGDKWNLGVNQMKAVWNQFLTSLTSWDWEGFGDRIKAAMGAATESTLAHDAEFEVSNSIKLRKAAMAEELAQLQILMRDTGKSYEERAKAAQQYLDKVRPIYEAEIDLRKRIYMTDTDEYLKNAGLEANAGNRDLLRKFFTDIAPNESLMGILNEYQKKVQGKKNYELSADDYKVLDAFYAQYGNKAGAALSVLAQYYQSTNDDVANKAVDAIMRYDQSIALFAEETRRIQTLQNSAMAQIEKGVIADNKLEKVADPRKIMAEMRRTMQRDYNSMNSEPIILDDLFELDLSNVENDMDAFLDAWQKDVEEMVMLNEMLKSSIVSSLSGGVQAMTEALFDLGNADASQIMSALLEPFAQTAIQLGEMLIAQGTAVEAFKTSLESLQGYAAIAAGVALIAVGTAMKAGIKSLAKGPSGSTSASVASSGAGGDLGTYDAELTINVVGTISGSDIILAGEKTLNKWSR